MKLPDHQSGVDQIGRSKATNAKTFLVPTDAHAGHNTHKHERKRKQAKHVTFDSTCLQNATFYPADETLRVTFTDGSVYEYDCDRDTFDDLKDSDSIGKFFNAFIRE